jgi:hypothetical protein
VLVFALVLLVSSVGAIRLLPPNETRAVAEGFVKALEGGFDPPVDGYIASDGEIFLHGAQNPMSPPQFRGYIDQLKRSKEVFQAVSPVYLTDGGAGWLVEIAYLDSPGSVNPRNAGPASPSSRLWMQARIENGRISRVWMHFTVEGLSVLHQAPEVYSRDASARGFPVPDDWSQGTDAMLAAAERIDHNMVYDWTDSARLMLSIVAGVGFVLVVFAAGLAAGMQRRRPVAARAGLVRGEMLLKLSQARTARLE